MPGSDSSTARMGAGPIGPLDREIHVAPMETEQGRIPSCISIRCVRPGIDLIRHDSSSIVGAELTIG